MNWVTIIWSMVASACLTLAAMNLLGLAQEPDGMGQSAHLPDGGGNVRHGVL